ncbi:MAG: tRNA guanosine(34) transglycosylase Tgt [Candidatus Diapherotrites archaeon]|uniref:tRNA guanosine(34) transglycosylase Tgt n=1 Tax=Candidatus Iainarchaeum sp. TaxID=3101447 RepID=A0A8T3YL18_9ARCH|nr:tRNA guanosine(34) transglycosylase Tgt [Candidatus Diapherotrites archaeon]
MSGFRLEAVSGKARAGTLMTSHGRVKTPFLMPVATKGSVKLLSMEEVSSAGIECIIANAFILSMRPGTGIIAKHGGLHRFMQWGRGLFTDSGGFQVLSREFCLGLSDEGVQFRNPFTGRQALFTPEESISIQNALCSDVAMCLDDVPRANEGAGRLAEAVARTTLWAKRCREAHSNRKQMLFGICQGGTDAKLRAKSAREITSLDFDGYAIGGLVIGEPKEKTFPAAEAALPFLPEEKPRYMMGVGDEQELRRAIAAGIDCFDSCFATRTARHGGAFTSAGNINIDSAKFRADIGPLDSACDCQVCANHSRAYIHHLFRTKEENAGKYLSYHNLYFLQKMLERVREEIMED